MRLVGVAWQSCQLGCSCGEDVRSSAASSTLRFPGRAKGFKGFPSNGFLTLLPPSPPLLLHPPPEWKSTKTQYWAQRPTKAVQFRQQQFLLDHVLLLTFILNTTS